MPYPAREIPPGSQFNNYKVLYELEKGKNRVRWFQCECDCGNTRAVRIDNLGKTQSCIECSKKYDHLYKQVPGCTRDIQDSHAWECWMNMHNIWRERGIPVCDAWKDFEPFLEFYLLTTGLSLSDVLRGRVERSFYRADRINKDLGWSPDNTTFVRFVTERAWHKRTHIYWWTLKVKGLLDEELLSYKNFINIFGVKSSELILRRKDITKPHSKENSFWQERNVRRSN